MKFKHRISNTFKSIKNSYKRFPVTIGVSITLVIMLIILSEIGGSITEDTRIVYQRINAIIALGIPLSLCIKLFFEKKKEYKKIHEGLAYLVGIILLLLYYFFLLKDFKMVSIYRYIGISIFLYLAFAYIPWINNKENYETYIIKVFSKFFLTIIYSTVLFLGIVAIFFTINQLFNANIGGKYFYYVFLIIAGVFSPSLFLAGIPEVDEKFKDYKYPKPLKALLLYIVIPLLTIYSTILYAYFLKIIVTRIWPQGLVSHLVLWYSTFSIAVIFFITPIIKENKWAHRFKTWFSRFIIPILIMMFISIGIRVRTYGITENRYFGIVLGGWVLGMMIYFIFRKKANNIIIPISLSIIVLNAVIGPLSSFAISKNSQNKRLESILIENKMIEDKKIIKSKEGISEEDKIDISGILNYFDSSHSLGEVKYIPEGFTIKDMERVLGFSYVEKNLYEGNNFYYYHDKEGKYMDIKGYDYLLEPYSIVDKVKLDKDTIVSYNNNSFEFKITQNDKVIYENNFKDLAEDMLLKNTTSDFVDTNDRKFDVDHMTIIDENAKVKIKVIFNNIYGEKDNRSEKEIIKDIDYYTLIKTK